MPHITQRQQHRFNPQSGSVKEYFKQTLAIPFLDYLITSIITSLDKHTTRALLYKASCPHTYIPNNIHGIWPNIAFYSEDLPNVYVIDEELHCWKSKWLKIPQK